MMLYCVHLQGKLKKMIFHVCLSLSDSACKNFRTADGVHEICYGVVLLKFVSHLLLVSSNTCIISKPIHISTYSLDVTLQHVLKQNII